MRGDNISVEGVVTNVLKNGYEVTLTDNGKKVLCTIAGKLRLNKIRCILHDAVTVSISPYDLTRGIITWRGTKTEQ